MAGQRENTSEEGIAACRGTSSETSGGTGTVLVVGGGIAGMNVAIEAAEAGLQAHIVEASPSLGGHVAQLAQLFPKMCTPSCGLELHFRRIRNLHRIHVHTLSRVTNVQRSKHGFKVTVEHSPRFVNERCTACSACVDACPALRCLSQNNSQSDLQSDSQSDPHNLGLVSTKAIYLPHAMAYPNRFVVDIRMCKGSSCAKCVDACTVGAIDLSEQPSTEVLHVGAVVVATGWQPYDARKLTSLGFGTHQDIITNLMLERYASPQGPTQGRICCPSDGREPRSVVFVQCAGSRDRNHLPYCSGVCCAATAKHVLAVRSALPNATIKVFAIDIRTLGKLETFYAKARELPNVSFHRGKVARVEAINNVLHLRVEDTLSGTLTSESADLVVLATGMVPSIRMQPLPFNMLLDEHHFGISDPTGILFAGCAKRPFSVAESVRDATAAALHAIRHQAVRGT